MLTALLVGEGYDVSVTHDPKSALDIARLRAPDAVFSSLVFHDMHGFQLCRQLRAWPETASKLIVALTGFAAIGVEEAVAEAGFDKYLLKPVNLEVLLSLLDTLKDAPGGVLCGA